MSKKEITLVLTSCNRPNELTKTLYSFFKYNTYPIKKIIIIDDSGIKNCIQNWLKEIPDNIKQTIIYNEKNIEKKLTIDKANSLLNSK